MPHAFISYTRDDTALVDYMAKVLEANGVKYWRDKNDIKPGARWRDAIRAAIAEGRFFIGVFSKAWESRERTYANEELVLAIEELRTRPTDRAWFIPIKIDDCAIPDRAIGGGERLSDINYIDLPKLGWKSGLTRLLVALGVDNPVVELGDPLGSGLPPSVRAKRGRITLEYLQPNVPEFAKISGTVFTVTEGWVTRDGGGDIIAYIRTQAPYAQIQSLNEMLGLDAFHIFCRSPIISADEANVFSFFREHVVPAGSPLWDMTTGTTQTVPTDIKIINDYTAHGRLAGTQFTGQYESRCIYEIQQMQIPLTFGGTFDIELEL